MEYAPGQMLPFDLSLVGAGPGCALLVNPGYRVVAYFTDPAGAASSSLTIPAGFGRFGTGWQWATLVTPSRSNPLGLETTANRAIWIGPELVVPNAQYVWDLSNVNATTGNSTTDSVPVVQFLL
jgi:hypothetical protein